MSCLLALSGLVPCMLALAYSVYRGCSLQRSCRALRAELELHRNAEQRLQFIAHHDVLTGLPNRLQFQIQLEHGLAFARRHGSLLALLFIDIDRFKSINDTLGHEAGDQVLMQFAQRLQHAVREVDTVARQGGDEFIVLLTELHSGADAARVADKIIAAMAAPFSIDGAALSVGASIGIAVYPDDDDDMDALIEKADLAMYAAKQRGAAAGMRYVASMQARACSHLILETALRHALQHEEFMLHYQPRMDLQQQRITGVKALLRWQHPELGLVLPLDFLPVLEASALIMPVGAWAMATGVAQAQRWLARGQPLIVALSLSARQFYHKEAVSSLAALLQQSGLPGQWIELEIAESILLDKNQNGEAILRQFRQLGVGISISAVATGYASLNYLRRFAVDRVKIDQGLVDTLRRDDDAMLRAIVALAHTLQMRVVAGGVESGAQLAQLAALGCDEAFGFCLSRAVAAAELEALLDSWHSVELVSAA
ncbi:MAG: putative bifunctional diguanylate cyclase/phosphodiesterase [Sphingomonadaceae bacterium]